MKIKILFILVLMFVLCSCSPAYKYKSQRDHLEEFKTNLDTQAISKKEKAQLLCDELKKEFPDYLIELHKLCNAKLKLIELKETGTLQQSDRDAFIQMETDFWSMVTRNVESKQQDYNAALLSLSDAFNEAGKQMRQNPNPYLYRTPVNCRSYVIGGTVYTSCY